MSNLRAHNRRQKRDRDRKVPVLPGIMPDRSDESKRAAMEQAHEELAPMNHSQVRIVIYSIDDGLKQCAALMGDNARDGLAAEVEARAYGPDAAIVFAMRMPLRRKRK